MIGGEEISIEKDHYLIREGEKSAELYYLQSGTMAIMKRKGDSEVQIGTVYSGEIVGEMSFLDGQPRSAAVKALSDCALIQVKAHVLDNVLDDMPKWYSALMKTLLDRLRRANVRIRI